MKNKKRYIQIGTGGRAIMFPTAILQNFSDQNEIVAVADSNPGRVDRYVKELKKLGGDVVGYASNQFEQMIAEQKPDAVIVTTQDSFHHQYVCRAMELGCDVMTEKPMTIDADRCRQILETQRRTKRRCQVTFNYRYAPANTQIKDLLMSGVIGAVKSVDFHWLLDTRHGADYFRRWHRNKANSGGLLVHKSTHHFDLMNWWLSAVPVSVYALGKRQFYTPQMGDQLGLQRRGVRCLDCPESGKCAFYMDLKGNQGLKDLYLDHEKHDGYFRDRCVFSKDIDIEDSMQVVIEYDRSITMSYSLNAFMPWEGYTIAFNGTKGRLEHQCVEASHVIGDGTVPGQIDLRGTYTRVIPHFAAPYQVEVWKGEGGHGGGDLVMLQDLFLEKSIQDKYLRSADQRAGAFSILCGIAGNQSILENKAIQIKDLVSSIEYPDYPKSHV